MKIFVAESTGRDITLEVELWMSVIYLKTMIRDGLGIPTSQQRLNIDGSFMDNDDYTLRHYNISAYSFIDVFPNHSSKVPVKTNTKRKRNAIPKSTSDNRTLSLKSPVKVIGNNFSKSNTKRKRNDIPLFDDETSDDETTSLSTPTGPSTSSPAKKGFCQDWIEKTTLLKKNKTNSFYQHLNDITIVSKDEEEIGCHRLILSVRSNVFSAMFQPDKKTRDTISIDDFEGTTIRQMIQFIYTDSVEDASIDFDLLAIAHKYEINELQVLCETKLSKQLDIENVLDAYLSASLMNSDTMLKACTEFLRKHWTAIEKTKTYSRLMRDNKESMIKLIASTIEVPRCSMTKTLLNLLS